MGGFFNGNMTKRLIYCIDTKGIVVVTELPLCGGHMFLCANADTPFVTF